jgi:hypothetical protein
MYATKKMEMVDQRERFLSRAYRAQSVLALASKNFVWFVNVPEGKLLLKGEVRQLKYDYLDK